MADNIKNKAGTGIGNQYVLLAKQPIDARYVVKNITERNTIISEGAGYPGLTVWVESEKKKYEWNGTAWHEATIPFATPITEGETKTLFRASAAATNDPFFAPSTPVYYPLCKLPIISSDNNYASAHITGRIGGWESYRVCHIDATITNRAAPSIASLLICNNTNAATLQNSAIGDIFTLTDIVCYTNDDSTVTIYLKAYSWFIFDLNIELYQKDAKLLFNGTYLSEIPGTESASLSTSQNLLMLANGKAQVKVDSEWKSLVDEKLLNDKVKGFLPFDDTYIDDLNTWQTNGYKKVSSSSTHHPIECRSTDKWGILFFIAENAKNGTGSQIYYPIDGPNVGRMYVRSILVHEPVVVEGKTDENGWYKVLYSTDEVEAVSTKGALTFTGAATGTFNGSENKTINIPSTTGELTNNSGFITKAVSDLTNYYNNAAIDGKIADLNKAITAIPKFAIKVVTALPTENISNTTVYLVKDTSNSKESENLYVEWIYVNNTWEKLGEQKVDLTGYATEEWVTNKHYLTAVPAEYITDTELLNKKYITNTKDAFSYSNLKDIPTDLATTSWVQNTAKAHDSNLLDGQDGSYYRNYNNLTNKPTIPSLNGYATQEWVRTAARAYQAEDINFTNARQGIPTAAYSLWPSARANRLSFLPTDQILIEQSTDGGKTWQDATYSDATKVGLFSQTRPSISIPLKDGKKNCDCMVRVTITAIKFKDVPENGTCAEKFAAWGAGHLGEDGKWISENYVSGERYCTLEGLFLWLSSNSDRIYCLVEKSSGAMPNSWVKDGEGFCTGWSGSDFIKLSGGNFGGGKTQTSNYWFRRFTFRTATRFNDFDNAKLGSSPTARQSISELTAYGVNVWTYSAGNNLMNTDRLYTWDIEKNAIFPAQIKTPVLVGTNQNINYPEGTYKGASLVSKGKAILESDEELAGNLKLTSPSGGIWPNKDGTNNIGNTITQFDFICAKNFYEDKTPLSDKYAKSGHTHDANFIGTAATISTTYTPAGTISTPTISITPNTTTITEVSSVGTKPTLVSEYIEDTEEVKLIFTSGTLPTTTDTTVLTKVTAASSKPSFTGTAATISTSYTPKGTITVGKAK